MNIIIGLILMQRDSRDAVDTERLGRSPAAAQHLLRDQRRARLVQDRVQQSLRLDNRPSFQPEQRAGAHLRLTGEQARFRAWRLIVDVEPGTARPTRGDPTRVSQALY